MTKSKPKPGDKIHIEGVSGQVAIGNNNVQTQNISRDSVTITKDELEALNKMFKEVKEQVAQEAPADMQEKALEKVTELEEAVKTEKPDITTMEYVKNWFGKNLPQLAGAVTSLVVNPIVGKLVQVAGDTIAQEFKRRFGET
jgi:hypothetical protein